MPTAARGLGGPRLNEAIRAPRVRLIDHEGENCGVVSAKEALGRAAAVGLDLVEIASEADPPVCRVLDYGKFKYRAQKKASEARKKQKTVDVKEVKLRPNINAHDYDVKLRGVFRFLGEGDKVKVTLRFRGRELAHQDLGLALMERVRASVEGEARVETEAKMEGRQLVMVLAPTKRGG